MLCQVYVKGTFTAFLYTHRCVSQAPLLLLHSAGMRQCYTLCVSAGVHVYTIVGVGGRHVIVTATCTGTTLAKSTKVVYYNPTIVTKVNTLREYTNKPDTPTCIETLYTM